MRRPPDPLLRTMPWKVTMTIGPIERILRQIETEGTVDDAQGRVVFYEDGNAGWYDAVAALRGVIEFHQIAEARYSYPADVAAIIKFANKLEAGAPIFETDIAQVRSCLASCAQQAMKLRLSQATDIVNTIRIGEALNKISRRAA